MNRVNCSPFNIFRCSADWRLSRMWIIFNWFPAKFEVLVPKFDWVSLIETFTKNLFNLWISSTEECRKFKQDLMHINCEFISCTMHNQTQWNHSTDWVTPWRVSVHACTVSSLWIGFQVISKLPNWLWRYNGWMLSG